MTDETDSGDNDQSSDKNEMKLRFAEALNLELDSIGFPSSPKRTGALADAVGFDRTQAYRVLKGLGGPSIPTLLTLHKLGVSIDRVLNEMNQDSVEMVRLRLGDSVVNAVFRECKAKNSPIVAVPGEDGTFDLRVMGLDQALPDKAIQVYSMHFPHRKLLAIIDDDAMNLAAMTRHMQPHFGVVAFSNATDLLAYRPGIDAFDLILLDWVLPDTNTEALIHTIRKTSSAPIFILTASTESVDSLTRAMDLPGVRHIGRPVHESILLKHLTQALA